MLEMMYVYTDGITIPIFNIDNMQRLPTDIFTECISFLWFRDVDSLSCCSKLLNQTVKSAKCFYSP